MIGWLYRWYFQRLIDEGVQPPRWVRRKLDRDLRLADALRRLREVDASLRAAAQRATPSLVPKPRTSGLQNSVWRRSLVTAALTTVAALIAGLIYWSGQTPAERVGRSLPIAERPVGPQDERAERVEALIANTRRTMAGLRVQLRSSARDTKPRDIWDKYSRRIDEDRQRLATSLSRLMASVSMKKSKQ